ncbi:alpha/beta hydrolase fold-containing protein 8 [Elsinoe australis]|uniref:Alpha/beta hydrolase fold-containing protein 8 n=1 Tax=Elsinoe australis TaxID=40998 RepID=A0A4V6DXJ8_9PEZI|nr:alpha/beta hydrolase fold-containing protein 8 [Elsinoe australis]
MPQPRWILKLKARVMRFLMSIGLFIHKLYAPRPPSPAFTRMVQSSLSAISGSFRVSVYTPRSYERNRRHSFKSVRSGAGYQCLVCMHGGGFTIGSSTDDARFIRTAIEQLDCVVLSVDYRLAPEHPFPTAVDDGADAILWAAEHADELGIDATSLAITGFSSGGNLTLSVPIRLHDHFHSRQRALYKSSSVPATPSSLPSKSANLTVSPLHPSASSTSLSATETSESIPLRTASPFQPTPSAQQNPPAHPPKFRISALAPFYPSTNYNLPRSVRRATNPSPAHDLPHGLTALFDESYIHPASDIRLDNPYLSPGMLSPAEMRAVYDGMRILGVGCEFDMLCKEGGDMMGALVEARGGGETEDRERTDGEGAEGAVKIVEERGVSWRVVKGVQHGWDKRPFLGEARAKIEEEYLWVCDGIAKVWGVGKSDDVGSEGESSSTG